MFSEAAIDDRQKYLTGVRYQRDTLLVASSVPIFFLRSMYHDDGIFAAPPPSPPPNTDDDIDKGGITFKMIFEQLNGDLVRSDSLSIC